MGTASISISLCFRYGANFSRIAHHGLHAAAILSNLFTTRTFRLDMTSPARRVFDIKGQEVFESSPALLCHPSMVLLLGRSVGPYWVTSGEHVSIGAIQGARLSDCVSLL